MTDWIKSREERPSDELLSHFRGCPSSSSPGGMNEAHAQDPRDRQSRVSRKEEQEFNGGTKGALHRRDVVKQSKTGQPIGETEAVAGVFPSPHLWTVVCTEVGTASFASWYTHCLMIEVKPRTGRPTEKSERVGHAKDPGDKLRLSTHCV